MPDDVQVYDHAVLSARARRLLVVLAGVAALVLGLVAPAQAANGHIVGTVTSAGAVPLEDVWVDVYDMDEQEYVGGDDTDAQGQYDVALPAGTYLVVFYSNDENYEPELYDDVHDFDIDAATPVVVTDGGSTQADAELTRTASISGHLTMNAADPEDAVRVYDDEGDVAGWGWVESDGSYEVNGLQAGSYRLAFNRLSGFAFSAAQFFDDHEEQAGLASADQVTLASGEARTGIDAVLVEGGHVIGTLRDSDGQPIHCRLQAFTTDRSLVTRSGWSDATTGAFDITGLTTGSYLVRVVNGQACQNGLQYVEGTGGPLSTDLADAEGVATTLGDDTPLTTPLVYDLGPQPSSVVPPSISGTPVVGALLTAGHGTWSPSSHLTYSYQWLSGGTPIAGAAQRTYRPAQADTGKALAVLVTAHRGSRTGYALSPATQPVSGGGVANLSAPSVSGPAEVDATLTVNPGGWSVPGVTFSYQWTSGPRVLATTSSPSFKVPDSVFRQPLGLTVIASRTGYASGSAYLPVSSKVLPGHWPSIKLPQIRGKATLGSTLTVHAAKVRPNARTVSFHWFRDGKRISSATYKHYLLTAADVGHRIRVYVIYGRQHYEKTGIVSKKTRKVTR